MNRYKFLRKKAFESHDKFENRINEECAREWRVLSMAGDGHGIYVLLERDNKHQ